MSAVYSALQAQVTQYNRERRPGQPKASMSDVIDMSFLSQPTLRGSEARQHSRTQFNAGDTPDEMLSSIAMMPHLLRPPKSYGAPPSRPMAFDGPTPSRMPMPSDGPPPSRMPMPSFATAPMSSSPHQQFQDADEFSGYPSYVYQNDVRSFQGAGNPDNGMCNISAPSFQHEPNSFQKDTSKLSMEILAKALADLRSLGEQSQQNMDKDSLADAWKADKDQLMQSSKMLRQLQLQRSRQPSDAQDPPSARDAPKQPQNMTPHSFYSIRSRAENEQAMQPVPLRSHGLSTPAAAEPCPEPSVTDDDSTVIEYLKKFVTSNPEADATAGATTYTSIGSESHASGTCRPCLFWYKGLCFKGTTCLFCHANHSNEEVHAIKPSKKTRVWLQRRARQLDMAVKTMIMENESSSSDAVGSHEFKL